MKKYKNVVTFKYNGTITVLDAMKFAEVQIWQ